MINLILTLALIGFLTWLIIQFVPMEPPAIKKVIVVIAGILSLLAVLGAFGIIPNVPGVRFPK